MLTKVIKVQIRSNSCKISAEHWKVLFSDLKAQAWLTLFFSNFTPFVLVSIERLQPSKIWNDSFQQQCQGSLTHSGMKKIFILGIHSSLIKRFIKQLIKFWPSQAKLWSSYNIKVIQSKDNPRLVYIDFYFLWLFVWIMWEIDWV